MEPGAGFASTEAPMSFVFLSPDPPHAPLVERDGEDWVDQNGRRVPARNGVLLLDHGARADLSTAGHYSKQWGETLGYAAFIRGNRHASQQTMARQLGWPALTEEIRREAERRPISVFDAACGFGGFFSDLFGPPAPAQLTYLGADIHDSLPEIPRPSGVDLGRARFIRWDIGRRVPVQSTFDYVVCRQAIHHTSAPRQTFRVLADAVSPGGVLAISAYAKKAPMREAVDDAMRAAVSGMTADDAFEAAREFSILGRDLQCSKGEIQITEDMPLLEIRKGTYSIHDFIYNYFMKCWHNPDFGLKYSDVVNYDWYHPPYAYRYASEELLSWFAQEGFDVEESASTAAQHYVKGRKRTVSR
jgi:SAM-dependent methyltransferase